MEFKIINSTPLYKAFSERGKSIYLPDGIFYWSGRAKSEAELIGTIGVAYAYDKDFINGGTSDWSPCYLENIKEYFKNVGISDLVTYASIPGIQQLRECWKKWIIQKSLYDPTSENQEISNLEKYTTTPIITAGVTNAIFLSCAMLLDPSDYIIIPNKRWGNYDNTISRMLGAKIQSFEFFLNNKFNVNGFKDAMYSVLKEQNKIIILLSFPNNPTGYIPTREELIEIIECLRDVYLEKKVPIVVLVDDAYEPYVFADNVCQRSIFYDLQQLEEDIIPIKLDGITKELLMYGGRIGFATIGLKRKWVKDDEELELLKSEIDNKLSAVNRSTISNCNHFYQAIAKKLLEDNNIQKVLENRHKVLELLRIRFEKINELLTHINDPKVSVDPNAGGFFVFLNLDPNIIPAKDFADHLLKNYKVGVIPIQNQKENINGIRIAYCSIDINQLPEFIKRITLALKDFN